MRTHIYEFNPDDAMRFAYEQGINAKRKGNELMFNVCPYCHGQNFYLEENGNAICCTCGTEGVVKLVDGKYVFEFDAEKWIPHAHDSISGKFIHGDDIMRNEGEARALMATDEAKARKQKYREFIQPSKP